MSKSKAVEVKSKKVKPQARNVAQPKVVDKMVVFFKGEGHKFVAKAPNPNYEPAKTGDRNFDKEKLQEYRQKVRQDVRAVNTSNSKRTSIFDAVTAKGWNFKSPHQAAQQLYKALKHTGSDGFAIKLL